MPPKSSSRKRAAVVDEYDSDGGFVEDAPRSKRAKSGKTAPSKDAQKDDEGNEFWELSDKRRVGVSTFKNMQLINIPEFYEKDGKTLPGRKGISLSVDQFSALLEILPQIETSLRSKGETVPRPNYGIAGPAAQSSSAADGEAEDSDEAEEVVKPGKGVKVEEANEDVPAAVKAPSKLDRFKYTKKNHEATSDEEE